MKGDLHCHTTLSDGSLGIEDIIVQAKRTGLDFISITDHDTMSSISRAKVLGERHGIITVPGVELSVKVSGIAVVDQRVHYMGFENAFCAADVLHHAFTGYRVKLHNLVDHFLCAGGAYLT